MISLEINPQVNISSGTLNGLTPTVSILGGPKMPILTDNVADEMMTLARATLNRFMQSTTESGPGEGPGLGALLMQLVSQPEFLGSLVPARCGSACARCGDAL